MNKTQESMSDRERILMNIAGLLAEKLFELQRFNSSPREGLYVSGGYCSKNDLKRGDYVVCLTSVGQQENPWVVSVVEEGGRDAALLRSIGTDLTCNYGNEAFLRINGLPERLLWEGQRRVFQLKVYKAIQKLDTYMHRFRGIEFVSDAQARIWFGEIFGGMNKPTKPYSIAVNFSKKTTVRNIVEQLKAGGHGSRALEPDDGKGDGPFHNPQPITRETVVNALKNAGMGLKE